MESGGSTSCLDQSSSRPRGTNEVLRRGCLGDVPGLRLHAKQHLEIICTPFVNSTKKPNSIAMRLATSVFAKAGTADGVGRSDASMNQERDRRVGDHLVIVCHLSLIHISEPTRPY